MITWAQTKNGIRSRVSPRARQATTVANRLTAPIIDDTPSRKMPASHHVWPDEATIASGGYDVQPELAAPPGSAKLAIISSPATR